MKLNIHFPKENQKGLKVIFEEKNQLLKGYCCGKECKNCQLIDFSKVNSLDLEEINKKPCNRCDLGQPVFTLKVDTKVMNKFEVNN